MLIAVVAIDVILIERRQSVRNTNASNATRNEATASNIVFKPQGGRAGEHNKSVVRVSRGRRESHNETHLATTIIVAGASIAAKQARRTQP